MHTKVPVSKTFRMAEQFGISRPAAARMRMRYLNQHLLLYLDYDHPVATHWALQATEEQIELMKKGYWQPKKINGATVDDERIERAKQFPITELITFTRGKAEAWCHDDKRPSLTYWEKGNIAKCWVCDKTFNPIDVLMSRDGMAFLDAVKSLT